MINKDSVDQELENEFMLLKNEELRIKNKQTKTLYIIFFAALILAFLSSIYAYLNYRSIKNQVSDKTGGIVIKYDNGADYEALDINPGWQNEKAKTFSIVNKSKNEISYNLTWIKVTGLSNQSKHLVYSLYQNDKIITERQTLPNQEAILIKKKILNPGETHNYRVSFYYLTLNDKPEDIITKEFKGTFWFKINQ